MFFICKRFFLGLIGIFVVVIFYVGGWVSDSELGFKFRCFGIYVGGGIRNIVGRDRFGLCFYSLGWFLCFGLVFMFRLCFIGEFLL